MNWEYPLDLPTISLVEKREPNLDIQFPKHLDNSWEVHLGLASEDH